MTEALISGQIEAGIPNRPSVEQIIGNIKDRFYRANTAFTRAGQVAMRDPRYSRQHAQNPGTFDPLPGDGVDNEALTRRLSSQEKATAGEITGVQRLRDKLIELEREKGPDHLAEYKSPTGDIDITAYVEGAAETQPGRPSLRGEPFGEGLLLTYDQGIMGFSSQAFHADMQNTYFVINFSFSDGDNYSAYSFDPRKSRRSGKYATGRKDYKDMTDEEAVLLMHYLESSIKYLSGQVIEGQFTDKTSQPRSGIERLKRFLGLGK